jgi:hypothetical protein
MNIFEMKEAPPTVLQALPVEVLMNLQEQANAHLADASKMVAILHEVLSTRYARGLNKTGTSHIEDGDVDVTVTIPKRVKYDQSLLRSAVETISTWGEDPDHYVDIEIKVSERKYDAWPPSIRDLFTPARTVETGKPKIELAPKKRRAA